MNSTSKHESKKADEKKLPKDEQADIDKRKKDKELDKDLKDTFPASDPITKY